MQDSAINRMPANGVLSSERPAIKALLSLYLLAIFAQFVLNSKENVPEKSALKF